MPSKRQSTAAKEDLAVAIESRRSARRRTSKLSESGGDGSGTENLDETFESTELKKCTMPKKRKTTSVKKDPETADEERLLKKRTEAVDTVDVKTEGMMESVDSESSVVVDLKPIKKDRHGEEEGDDDVDARFLGEPVPDEEARQRWPNRYQNNQQEIIQARCHFVKAEVDGQVFCLEDDAFVEAEEGKESYICKIIEFFKAVDGSQHFTAQWYYRAADTVIKTFGDLIDNKRIFFSEIKDENPLDCLIKKLTIVPLLIKAEFDVKDSIRSTCDYYFDKKYLLPYSTFVSLPPDGTTNSGESGSTISTDADACVEFCDQEEPSNELTLLDLYAGCGAMSTGLCLGANSAGVKLVTKWAVDINQYACESLKLNHPETQVRNESAEDFLSLLKDWEKLCKDLLPQENNGSSDELGKTCGGEDDESDENGEDANGEDPEVFEVDEILTICYGDPNHKGKQELHFKIRWKGYGPEEDTWEPIEGLSACQDKLKGFVSRGYKSKLLPLPGTVDVICGGPPCQGISGFNRFRNKEAPLEDPKNKQLVVYMNIVAFLKPRFCLMENVVDILKFADGFLGRFALARLLSMGYQARVGMMAAGCYGLPQFRMRMFMWGALPNERLPQYPLPTHNAKNRGVVPTEFESNTVAYEQSRQVQLKDELFLGDAISDLPPVENDEKRDKMSYDSEPQTEFQHFIRLPRNEMPGYLAIQTEALGHSLYDHQPLLLNQDDLDRVIEIPKKKGANFRDLPGVKVRADNKVEWDPDVERKYLKSGKPLVPDYAMSFVKGTSSKPFGRLWWDETVPTVVTRAEPHNQAILHPLQDRVLTIRENARLQGFPDYYKLVGPIKERYIQVGNAVAVPVARALGYSLALALKGLSGNEPVFTLPQDYPLMKDLSLPQDMIDECN